MPSLIYGKLRIPLEPEAAILIGRDRGCQIIVRDDRVDPEHAKVHAQGSDWWVTDLESETGTKINGLAMLSGESRLKGGDVITIGMAEVRFSEEDPKEGPEPDSREAVHAGDQALLGSEIAGMRVESFLARNLTGVLYKAHSARRKQSVMLKVLDRRLPLQSDFADRFLRDLTMAASVDHPAKVRILRSGREAGLIWYSMAMPIGDSLAKFMHKALVPSRALTIAIELGEAIDAYHERGLVHGDINPGCAYFVDLELRLVDIGLIGLTRPEVAQVQALSSPWENLYTCPAQARTGQCNARGDIYALGCMLFQLLMGRPPYQGHDAAETIALHEQEPIPEIAGELRLAHGLDEVLTGMLQKDPFFRYNNMRSALDALRPLLLGLGG